MSRSRLRRRLGRIRPWWRRFKRNGYHLDRCDLCGQRFRWSRDSRHSYTGSDKHWHGYCQAYIHWRRKADDRLAVLGLVMELVPITDRDVKLATELRAETDDQRVADSNRAFRVFYDLGKAAAIPAEATS